MSRKDVLRLLNQQSHGPREIPMPKPKLSETLRPRIRHQGLVLNATGPVVVKVADEVITTHQKEASMTSNKVRDNIRNQEGNELKERLEARKRSNSSQPGEKTKPIVMRRGTVSKADIAEQQFEKYQEEIEKIVEKYLEEKITRIQEVKSKYKERQLELKTSGNEELLQELDREMLREIEEVTQQIAHERKREISELKEKIC